MRYLLLLFLSFPAYASMYEVNALTDHDAVLTGTFAPDLSFWEIQIQSEPAFGSEIEKIEPLACCNSARKNADGYDFFRTNPRSPWSPATLHLVMNGSGPLLPGSYMHFLSRGSDPVTGQITQMPEPSTALLLVLGLLLVRLLSKPSRWWLRKQLQSCPPEPMTL